MCRIWTSEFNNTNLGAYGKAQKIINMTFKYLYCFYHTKKEYEAHFNYCHMPLDSYTLEWFKRTTSMKLTIKKMESWSKVQTGISSDSPELPASDEKNDKYTYEFYRNKIREIADNKGCSPLEIEFVAWPETQLILATEAYLFALNPGWDNKEREKARKMTLYEKIETINKIVEKNNLGINETYWFR